MAIVLLPSTALAQTVAQAATQAQPPVQNAPRTPQSIFSTGAPAPTTPQTLCTPQVVGNRRIPKESVLARLFSHAGDTYDPIVVERDFNSLWNTGYFDDVRIERADTPTCVQLVIYVREKPTIREINYTGLNAVSQSDVLERFKKAKVAISVESQYNPANITRAVVVLKELLSEHGHQFATVRWEVKTIPPAAVSLTFKIKEGPTVKVGKIAFDGNTSVPDRALVAAMKNLKPIGIPHSIVLENLFAKTYDASKLDEDVSRVQFAYKDRGFFKALTGEPTTQVRDAGGINPLTLRPSTGKRVDILIPVEEGERYRLGGITFKGNKNLLEREGAARASSPRKTASTSTPPSSARASKPCSKAYGEVRLHQLRRQPQSTRRRSQESSSISTSTSTRASSSTSPASSSPATPSPATRSSAAKSSSRKARSTTRSSGTSRCCASTSSTTSRRSRSSRTVETPPEHRRLGTVDLLLKLQAKKARTPSA